MKTIGLIGGMSWESTALYYKIVNQVVNEKLGGLHSAKVVLYSVDFAEIEALQHAGDWEVAGEMLANAARSVEKAGADFLVLCTNTMHKVAEIIESTVHIPLLHIAEATAIVIKEAGFTTIGLLGTRFTMEQAFYKERLSRYGLQVLIPNAQDRNSVHNIIYDELCLGKIIPNSREQYRRIIASLISQGAEGVILGCTEISLLVDQTDSLVRLFDTTEIHARSAASLALQ